MNKFINVSYKTCDILENIAKSSNININPLIEFILEEALINEDFLNVIILKLGERHLEEQPAAKEAVIAEREASRQEKEAAKEAAEQAKIIAKEERYKRSTANLIERDKALADARRERKEMLIKSPEALVQEMVDRKLAASKAKATAEEIDYPIRVARARYNKALKDWTDRFKEKIDSNVKLMALNAGLGLIPLNDAKKNDLENLSQTFPDIYEGPNKKQQVQEYIDSQLIFIGNSWFDYVNPITQKQKDIINDLKNKAL